MSRLFLATLRATFQADDDVEARLIANEIEEHGSETLEDEDTIDVTQVIPYDVKYSQAEPTELVNQLRLCRDMLIMTRIKQCFEQAQELDKMAWILEHRQESTFDLTSYDYGAIFEIANKLLGRKE